MQILSSLSEICMRKYDHPFKIRVPAELKRDLDDFVKMTGQTRSSFVREAIAAFIHKQPASKRAENAEAYIPDFT